ncbi:M15 family metallopeptidase [Demequina sp. SYSU T00192]|uniref:M15 family metallopeptidase n=1 Tax=Demequina litoralis TaxID=3051660 RepID=A0ABT8GDY7_9MICO|nr:M15 family metallopeptidase [Demequina sp. SYSU T00192]MDN4476884.1 M15 family metallopeptidase [Demequina sp. SYSU T00192]
MRAAMLVVTTTLLLTACTAAEAPTPRATVTETPEPQPAITATVTPEPAADPAIDVVANPFARPEWLGTTVLQKQDNDLGKAVATPKELRDRRLEPRPGAYPDPEDDAWFVEISAIPDDVLARSSWREECPVEPEDLAYIVMPFWGFDLQPHTGEMITSAAHAEEVAAVFEQMYVREFPIEEMRVTTWDEVRGDHTGDLNVTISFECRKVTGGYDVWSEHASGLAIDINPFHNPWVRDGYVFPELAGAYRDREWLRPGMIETQRQIIRDFAAAGWEWGGTWTDLDDWMHFSATGL